MPVQLPTDLKTGLSRKLSHSVMDGSRYMFDVMNFGSEWLTKPVSEWENHESFCEMKSFVKNLLVTNDAAERGIKLISDYDNSLTKNSEERQQLLQVVEKHRRELPVVSKANLSKTFKAMSTKD